MCFTPTISLTTAIIEFIVAIIILIYYQKPKLNRYFALLLFLLGFYQFSEFMLCTSSNPLLWARIGFITYTFLPAAGLALISAYTKNKIKSYLIYAFPLLFSTLALTKDFVVRASCRTYFVIVNLNYYDPQTVLWTIYMTYYFGFIFLMCLFLIRAYSNRKNRFQKILDINFLFAILITLLPALILLILFPSMKIEFPSVYCQFSILYTIAALIAIYIEKKFNVKIPKK